MNSQVAGPRLRIPKSVRYMARGLGFGAWDLELLTYDFARPTRPFTPPQPPRLPRPNRPRPRHLGPCFPHPPRDAGGGHTLAAQGQMDRRGQSATLPPQGKAGDLADDGRRPLAPRDLRLQTQAGKNARRADAGVVHQRQTNRPVAGREAGDRKSTRLNSSHIPLSRM